MFWEENLAENMFPHCIGCSQRKKKKKTKIPYLSVVLSRWKSNSNAGGLRELSFTFPSKVFHQTLPPALTPLLCQPFKGATCIISKCSGISGGSPSWNNPPSYFLRKSSIKAMLLLHYSVNLRKCFWRYWRVFSKMFPAWKYWGNVWKNLKQIFLKIFGKFPIWESGPILLPCKIIHQTISHTPPLFSQFQNKDFNIQVIPDTKTSKK